MTSILGVGAGRHNVEVAGSPIDWPAVKAAGYAFAFVRTADGRIFQDWEFTFHIALLARVPTRTILAANYPRVRSPRLGYRRRCKTR